MFGKNLKSAAFGLALLLSAAPVFSAKLNGAALRDIRIYISFEAGSGYDDDYWIQDEFHRASRLAMQMWEGVFPAMRVKFVPDRSSANIIFSVGNHGHTVVPGCGRGYHVTERPLGWIGCSLNPNDLGYINRDGGEAYNEATLYFNTKGQPNFRFDQYTYESRHAMWTSYQPATFPPLQHNDGSGINGKLGWINGRFLRMNLFPLDQEDATWIITHEFGHCFGQDHEEVFMGLNSYGCPGYNCASPRLVGPYPPEITHQYYGCGTPTSPCSGDLRYGTFRAHHMAEYKTSPANNGIPKPPLADFNFRVLRQDAFDFLLGRQPGYNGGLTSYPNARGLIRLQTSPTGSVALANNWTKAIGLAQLANTNTFQNAPFMVSGIFNQGQLPRVAAGFNHVLAIRADGTLWAWGANDKGQLGNGVTSATPSASPVAIMPSINTWVSVAAGNGFSMALRSDNTLWAWGSRSNGQLGDGVASSTPVTSPKSIGINEWAAVKTGGLHTVALKVNGTLWAWGYNAYGQLGMGGTSQRTFPTQENNGYTDWVGLAAGEVNSAGQRADGTLWTWGWNDHGNVGDGTYSPATLPRREVWDIDRWQLPSLGYNFSMNLDREGRLWTWGNNAQGQLGASPTDMAHVPMDRLGEGWVTASAGQRFAGAIKKDGTLWSWGSNASGQLGGGSGAGSQSATPVQEITRKADWQEVYNGLNTAYALKDDGSLWAWGNNASGQLGTGSAGGTSHTPVRTSWAYLAPALSLSAPAHGTKFKNGSAIGVQAKVTSGSIQRVEFWRKIGATNARIGTAYSSPDGTYSATWMATINGRHSITAIAYDVMGRAVTSAPIEILVDQVTIVSGAYYPSTHINLSTEGTLYWGHFGLAGVDDLFTTVKSGLNFGLGRVQSTGTDYQPVNDAALGRFTWTGGNPVASASSTQYGVTMTPTVASSTEWDSFLFESWGSEAITGVRVMKIYMQATGVNTRLIILSGSLAWSVDWDNPTGLRVFTVTYQVSDPLVIHWKTTKLNAPDPKMRIQAMTVR